MIRQTLFAGLFAVTGFATAPVANADAAGEALVRDALNAISSAPGWTATSDVVRSEGDRVLVEGLSIGHSSSSLSNFGPIYIITDMFFKLFFLKKILTLIFSSANRSDI